MPQEVRTCATEPMSSMTRHGVTSAVVMQALASAVRPSRWRRQKRTSECDRKNEMPIEFHDVPPCSLFLWITWSHRNCLSYPSRANSEKVTDGSELIVFTLLTIRIQESEVPPRGRLVGQC